MTEHTDLSSHEKVTSEAFHLKDEDGCCEKMVEVDPIEYLQKRHGRSDLDPLPSTNDNDPLNWSPYRKAMQLSMVSFHAFLCTFIAAGMIPSFAQLLILLQQLITKCLYLTLAQIIVLGVFPLLWIPVMHKYGRHQLLIILTLGLTVCNIGCIYASLYGSLLTCRILGAFMISPATAVGGSVVSELSFLHQRASRTGLWAVGVTLGTHVGPLLMGFVEYHTGQTKYIFVVFAVMNALQFLLYLFLGRETVFDVKYWYPGINSIHRITVKSDHQISWSVILGPLWLFKDWRVMLATVAYSTCFAFANVALGVELAGLYFNKYGFNAQQVGLQFILLIVGVVLGEQVGGWISDYWMSRRKDPRPEDRLWISYIGYAFCLMGNVIYGVMFDHDKSWTIVPDIGLAFSLFGLQIVTTVLITYSIDINPLRASEVSLFITLIRQIFGFVGPFYFPVMIDNPHLAVTGTYCLLGGLMVVIGWIPTVALHVYRT